MPPKRKRAAPQVEHGEDEDYAPKPRTRKAKKAKAVEEEQEEEGEEAGSSSAMPEKRLAKVRKSCPQNIQERVHRVMTQRFFMIDRERNDNELRETFKVLGSTGNVYTVVIDLLPSCNCPDAGRGNHCKHILFIFLKVLGVPQDSSYYYQKALLSSELHDIFEQAPKNPSAVASQRVRDLYAEATGSPSKGKAKAEAEAPAHKELEDGDDCPVCYEAMKDEAESNLVFCETCRNGIHKECFQQWKTSSRGKELTCVWCRSPWVDSSEVAAGGGATMSKNGYINLAGVAGVSRARDTSTYYQGYGYRYGKRNNYYNDD